MGTIENCGIPLALFHTGIKSLTPFEKHRAEKGVVSQVRANKSGIALSPNRVTYARRAVAKSNLPDKSGHEINSYTIFFFFFSSSIHNFNLLPRVEARAEHGQNCYNALVV